MLLKEAINKLYGSTTFANDHTEALMLLERCGSLSFLRAYGRARVARGASDLNSLAVEAAWSSGFNDALDLIENLTQEFSDKKNPNDVPMTFRALKALEANGDLMPEELHAIRTGTKPVYPGSTHTSGTGKLPRSQS